MSGIKKLIEWRKAAPSDKPRPYWHKDAKWVLSLLLCVVLGLWLLLAVVHKATSRDVAVDTMTGLITFGVAQHGQVDQQAVDELRRKIAESPTKSIQPIEGFPITIAEADLQLPPDQLVDKIFRQLTVKLYDKGARQLAEEQTSDKAQQDKFVNDASAIALFSKEGHDKVGTWLLVTALTVLILMIGTAWFSHGFGRLVTPGLVILVVSLPGFIIFSALTAWSRSPAEPASEAENYIQLAANARGVLEPILAGGQQVYRSACLVAVGLLAAALVGKIVVKLVARANRKPQSERVKL